MVERSSVRESSPCRVPEMSPRSLVPDTAIYLTRLELRIPRVLVPGTAIYLTHLGLRIPTSQLSLSKPQKGRRKAAKLNQKGGSRAGRAADHVARLDPDTLRPGASSKPPGLAGLPVSR